MTPEYYPDFDQRKRLVFKIGIITVVIITLVIISYVIFSLIFRAGKVKVEVIYAPYYAEVELDGKKIKNRSTRYLEPGEHEVKISAAEFEEYSTKVKVDENTEYIYGALNPATAKGAELANDTLLEEFLEIEGISGQVAREYGERVNAEYPILQKLPYGTLYSLGYLINSGERNYILTLDTKGADSYNYLNGAVGKLLSFTEGSDKTLAEYRIEFVNPKNPFEGITKKSTASDPGKFLAEIYGDLPMLTIYAGEQKEDYYYTVINYGSNYRAMPATYRVVLRKKGDSWELAGVPMPAVTTENMPGVPLEILNTLNEIESNGLAVEMTTIVSEDCLDGNCG